MDVKARIAGTGPRSWFCILLAAAAIGTGCGDDNARGSKTAEAGAQGDEDGEAEEDVSHDGEGVDGRTEDAGTEDVGTEDAGSAVIRDASSADAAERDGGGVGRSDAGIDAASSAGDAARPSADASIDDVDLTLGGFNQDLAAPSVDCVNRQGLLLGCVSLAGTYNGASFQFSCEENKLTVGRTASHLLGCRGAVPGGDLVVELRLDPALIGTPPRLFSLSQPSTLSYVSVWHLGRSFTSYPDGVFKLSDTHEQSMRVTGISEIERRGTPTAYDDWRIRGAYALSLTPKSSCVANGSDRICDEVKLRASFYAYPIEK